MRVRGWRVKRSCGWSKRKEQEVVRDPVKVWFGPGEGGWPVGDATVEALWVTLP